MNTERIATGTAEIRKRKKRFWGFFLTLAMIMTMIRPAIGKTVTVTNTGEGLKVKS